MNTIYFDNAATTRPFDEVIDAVLEIMEQEYYNPSSPYRAAIEIEKRLDIARENILKVLGSKGRIIFTSGGSESNNLAIRGITAKLKNSTIITSATEHPSVLKTCQQVSDELESSLVILNVDKQGHVIEDELIKAVSEYDNPFVSIMHVNNETGTINDIKRLSQLAKEYNPSCLFHVDGVQGFMKSPINLADTMVDSYSISAHKIHGPKGVGALYIIKDNILKPVTAGGGQEDSYRAGTHNTHGIAGLGKAVEVYTKNIDTIHDRMRSIKNTIIRMLNENELDFIVCGDELEKSAPHILNIAFRKIKGEVLLSSLEQSGIIANTGSACSSKKIKVSSVLSRMNIDKNYIEGALRLSFGAMNTVDEAVQCADVLTSSVKRLIKFS